MAQKRTTISRKEMLIDGSDHEFRGLIHEILAFASRILEIRNGFGKIIGLTGNQYTILISIAYLEGDIGVSANTIADHLYLSSASVTIDVNRLVALNLVDKGTDEHDKRRIRLRMTKEGRRRLAELTRVQSPTNDALFDGMTRAEFQMLRSTISRLLDQSNNALALLDFHLARTGT